MDEPHTYTYSISEEERAARRARRTAARKRRERERRRRMLLRLLPALALAVLAAAAAIWLPGRRERTDSPDPAPAIFTPEAMPATDSLSEDLPDPAPASIPPPHEARSGPDTVSLAGEIDSEYGILIDLDAGTILAEKKAGALVSPASMTKILTILTAAEHTGGLGGTYVVTQEIADYCHRNNCSVAGFLPGEEVSLTDLFYGTILPSGADASLALACYVAGSQEAFVELMNQKAAELGLSSGARFANCVGLYDEDNVCTVYDMALVLWAAMDNDVCRKVLTERTRVFPPNQVREAELTPSNWFIRRIEDHMPDGVQVLGAKTGYVSQSGSCAASYAQDAAGRSYICVTAKSSSAWRCIFDHAALYERFVAPKQE